MLPFTDGNLAIGIAFRRLKWHVAEYNRIAASLDRLTQKGLAREAEKALVQRFTAANECLSLLRFEEPDWGTERDITEKFLVWDGNLENFEGWRKVNLERVSELLTSHQEAVPQPVA